MLKFTFHPKGMESIFQHFCIQCFKHENSKYNYIVGLNYENVGHHGWEPLTTTSFIDFIKILGNDDVETGHRVFAHILKKIYYEANE